jgi:hypothetical protein
LKVFQVNLLENSLFPRTEDSFALIVTQARSILSLPSDYDGLMSTEGDIHVRAENSMDLSTGRRVRTNNNCGYFDVVKQMERRSDEPH